MVVGVVGDALTGQLISAVDGLKNTLRETIAFADNAQKASLALGSTYEQTRDSLGSTMQGLRGDINQRFGAAIAGMEAGLQGNTAGVARLINQQQLTGTAYRDTAKAFASLEAGMNLSREETNVLSNSLIETGDMYGISTDNLVKAIDSLKATFPAQKLAGMGSEVMQAVTLLQGELGPQLAGPLNKVMSMVMDTSMDGYEKLTRLGIGGLREEISSGDKSAQEIRQLLMEAVKTADQTVKLHTAGADKFFAKIGIAEQNLGTGILDFTVVADAFGKRTAKEGEQAVDFGKTLQNLKNEIFTPFQEGLAVAYPFFLEAIDTISGIFNRVGNQFKEFAEGLAGPGSAKEAMKTVQLSLINFSRTIITSVSVAFDALTRDGGLIDKLKAGFFRVLATINDFQGMALFDGADENAAEERAEANRAIARELQRTIDQNQQSTFKPSELAIIKELNKASLSIEDGNGFARQSNESLRSMSEDLNEINTKTPDPNEDTNPFVAQTAELLSTSIENILGIGPDTTAAEMLEEMQTQTDLIATAEGSVTSKTPDGY